VANILIVDRQEWVIDLFLEKFTNDGHKVSVTDDITSIREKIFSFNPDMVLLNLSLKAGFNSWDVLKDIKKQSPQLPVVIVTSHDIHFFAPRFALANGHVVKSCPAPNELKQRKSDILGN
jgi:DNA-binding NtrC family response regulator